jgi:uncharacterized integral membrane protein
MQRPDEPRPDEGREWTERREGPGGIAILLIVVAVLLLVFVLQNTNEADVNFLFWDAAVPLWIVIAIAAGLGFAGGWLVAWLRARRRRDG